MPNHKLVERDPEHYFKYRPRVPEDILNIAKQLYRNPIELVVDLGSGPGNSTQDWSKVSSKVIGIEPSKTLFDFAVKNQPENVSYLNRFAENTGIDSGSVDIVTSSNAIHWMEPEATSIELMRVLKNNGMLIYFAPSYIPLIPFFEIERLKINYSMSRPQVSNKQRRYKWGESLASHFLKDSFKYKRLFYISDKKIWTGHDYLEWMLTAGDKRIHNTSDNHFLMLEKKIDELWRNEEEVFFSYTVWCFKEKIDH